MNIEVYQVNIYEETTNYKYPVVQHNFYGQTREEAYGYYKAHLETDIFLRECVEKNRFNGIICRVRAEYWNCRC